MTRTNRMTLHTTCLVICIALMTYDAKAGTSTNCFYNNDLTYVYDLYDYSGNFTNVKEYTMKAGSECDFIVDTKSKLTWYAPDLEVK